MAGLFGESRVLAGRPRYVKASRLDRIISSICIGPYSTFAAKRYCSMT